ncbi:S-adenosyl-L-methionine-dependent methyltransferase [Mycena amicta]|nr:S-adenosyl-L-methionine-dependent methyltransferase [Mycena amicta]KAJ7053851.1 S-adenosyl-L-methionine-dependent methyltransferase [Mycena amicta]
MATSLEKKAANEKGYDAVADQYLAWSGPRPTTTRMQYIAELSENLPAKAEILELGCGAGVPATQVLVSHDKGFDVTGNDISAAQIALAKQHVPGAKAFIQGDMLGLDFPAGSFDAVLAFYSIFHLPKEEQEEMIEKIYGWLKPGGWFLCNFQFENADNKRDGWFKPEVTVFSSGLGVEGTREVFKQQKFEGFKLVVDKVDVETVGRFEEKFHWIMAQKEA